MRVLVLGAGYAGVVLARALEESLPDEAELVVVDESPYHLVQHELHRVVRRPGFADTITIPLDELFDSATIRQGTVVGVDTDERYVELADGDTLRYDVAAVCLGAETNFYGMADVEEHAHPLKRIPDAEAIRQDALRAFEAPSPTLVVGGAGLSGVQLAGELATLAREEGVATRVLLLEQKERVAPAFDASFGEAIHEELVERGVEVWTGASVTGADTTSVTLADGRTLPYDVLAWTGGIQGTRATDGIRPTVRATLDLDDRTFVVGDAASVVDADGPVVAPSAQAAIRAAEVAAENVLRVVDDIHDDSAFTPRLERFVFESPGWLVSVGDGAVAQVGSTVFTGTAAKTLKAGVGAGYLANSGQLGDAISLFRSEYGTPGSTTERSDD